MTILLAAVLLAQGQASPVLLVAGRPKTVEALRLPLDIALAERTLERAKFLRAEGPLGIWVDPQLVMPPEIAAASESLKVALKQGTEKVTMMSSLPEKERQALRRTILAGPIPSALTRKGSQGDAIGFGFLLDVEVDGKRYQAHMRPPDSEVPAVPEERKRAATPGDPADALPRPETTFVIRSPRHLTGDMEIAMQRAAQQEILDLRKRAIDAFRKEAEGVRREFLAALGSADLPWGEDVPFDDLSPTLKSKVRESLLRFTISCS
jgi:hypothetical protein